jgi:hypothetical protein
MGYQLIEHIEVGSGGAASIEFTGIPQDGVDLVLLASLRTDATGDLASISTKLNGVGTGYNLIRLYGSGSSVNSDALALNLPIFTDGNAPTANTFGSASLTISNYTSSQNKSISSDSVSENNGTVGYQQIAAMSFTSSSAITSLTVVSYSANNLLEYSTASLYMITAD